MFSRALLIVCAFCAFTSVATADVTVNGDVTPADYLSWDSDTWLSIGHLDRLYPSTWQAHVEISGVSSVNTGRSSIGGAGYTARARVVGSDATWHNSGTMGVGQYNSCSYSSTGILNIDQGGQLYSNAFNISGKGSSVNVDGEGSLLQTNSFSMNSYVYANSLNLSDDSKLTCSSATFYTEAGTNNLNISSSSFSIAGDLTCRGTDNTYVDISAAGSLKCNDASLHNMYISIDGVNSSMECNVLESLVFNEIDLTDGAQLTSDTAAIELTHVSLSGIGTKWESENLELSFIDTQLELSDYALLQINDSMSVEEYCNIFMRSNAKLAMFGRGDATLSDFYNLINCQGNVNFWDEDIAGWKSLTNAVCDEDYTLDYHEEGLWAGYTFLTVPEPSSIAFMMAGIMPVFLRRR